MDVLARTIEELEYLVHDLVLACPLSTHEQEMLVERFEILYDRVHQPRLLRVVEERAVGVGNQRGTFRILGAPVVARHTQHRLAALVEEGKGACFDYRCGQAERRLVLERAL